MTAYHIEWLKQHLLIKVIVVRKFKIEVLATLAPSESSLVHSFLLAVWSHGRGGERERENIHAQPANAWLPWPLGGKSRSRAQVGLLRPL